MNKLHGKTALVTGGGSGIGLAVARLLLEEGARVAIAGRSVDKLRAAAAALNVGDRLVWHSADVAKPASVEAMVQDVTARLGHIDILVNNAGANIKERAFRELTTETWEQMIGANLDGAFNCMRAVLPQMRERKDGLIININSTSGKRASPLGGAGYVAAKFGLRGLTAAVAAEEKDSGVRLTSIFPGEVDTPILDHRPVPVTTQHRQRILQPEDVASAVLFIATLPPRAWVPELVIAPTTQQYM